MLEDINHVCVFSVLRIESYQRLYCYVNKNQKSSFLNWLLILSYCVAFAFLRYMMFERIEFNSWFPFVSSHTFKIIHFIV